MTIEYKIEKNILLPEATYRKTGLMATIRALEIGDSFFVSKEEGSMSFQSDVKVYARRAGIKVTTRHRTENNIEGVRVWRTE